MRPCASPRRRFVISRCISLGAAAAPSREVLKNNLPCPFGGTPSVWSLRTLAQAIYVSCRLRPSGSGWSQPLASQGWPSPHFRLPPRSCCFCYQIPSFPLRTSSCMSAAFCLDCNTIPRRLAFSRWLRDFMDYSYAMTSGLARIPGPREVRPLSDRHGRGLQEATCGRLWEALAVCGGLG